MAIPFTPTTGSAAIGDTEISLITGTTTPAASTTACELEVWLDLSAMVAGDTIRIRVYEKVNGGSQTPQFEAFATGATPILYRVPVRRVNEGWDVRLIKIQGATETISWSLRVDAGDRNALTIGANAITAAAAATDFGAEIAAAVWSAMSEVGETVGDAIRNITARLLGDATVPDGNGAYSFRSKDGSKVRYAATRAGTARTTTTRDGT